MCLHIIDLIHIFIGIEVLSKTVELERKLCNRVVHHNRLPANLKSLFHHILIDHGTKLPVFQTKGFQNFFSGFDHGQIRVIQLTAIYLVVVLIQQSIIVSVLTGLHRQDSVPTDFPCSFVTHNLRLRHIGCTVTLHDFCELADVEHIVADLGVVLVDEFAGLHDGFIGIVNLNTAAVRNTKQILIAAVDKSDVLAVRVIFISHLRFPPLSNSMLNLIFPSSNTSI